MIAMTDRAKTSGAKYSDAFGNILLKLGGYGLIRFSIGMFAKYSDAFGNMPIEKRMRP